MSTLDDFLRNRREQGADDELNSRLLREGGAAMLDELKLAVQTTATRVGSVDGNVLEWNPFPFLKLQYVAATFTPGTLVGGRPTGCRVVIGRIPTALYVDDNPLPSAVWELSLGVKGNQLVWDVKGEGSIVGISTLELAEQIVRRLIEYRDAYQDACSKALL